MTISVLAIATGKPLFVQLGVNLALSFRRWNEGIGFGFAIATDQPELLPTDIDYVTVLPLRPGQYGSGLSPKLYSTSWPQRNCPFVIRRRAVSDLV